MIGFDARAHLSSGGSSKRYFLDFKYFVDILRDPLWFYICLNSIFSFCRVNYDEGFIVILYSVNGRAVLCWEL